MPGVPPRADPPPQPPVEPDPGDCCGEGCVNCVFDAHEAAVARYELALARWRERNPGRILPVK